MKVLMHALAASCEDLRARTGKDRKNRFANFLLENLKEISVLKSGNIACEKQNGGRFVANFVNFLMKL
jgi:hypothetical protein